MIDGSPYITAIQTTEEERKEREPVFREKISPFVEDFDSVWNTLKTDLIKMYKEAEDSRGLKEWSDIKELSSNDLLSFFLDFAYVINRKEGKTHMIMLMASYYMAGLFQQMWRDIFRVEASIDPDYNKAMAGFENRDIRIFRKLWRLSRKAVDLGIEKTFEQEDSERVIKELETSE